MAKKFIIFLILAILLVFTVLASRTAYASPCPGARGLVQCGNNATCPCELSDLFLLIVRIYRFIVIDIATVLGVFMIIVGGVLLMISAGYPTLAGLGRKILWATFIGLVLAYCSWLIIDLILKALGFTGDWSQLRF